jgi:hypothetical protein
VFRTTARLASVFWWIVSQIPKGAKTMKRMLSSLTLALAFLAVCGCSRKAEPAIPLSLGNNTEQQITVLHAPRDIGTEILLSSDGNDASGSVRALSSDNSNERLQLVRQAQDKWGAHKVAQGIDQFAIVGRWNNPVIAAASITFNADGTFKNVSLLKDTEGTYHFLSNDVIEFTYPGMLYGENVTQFEYRLLGDTLELKQLGAWIKYHRATP